VKSCTYLNDVPCSCTGIKFCDRVTQPEKPTANVASQMNAWDIDHAVIAAEV